MSPMLVLDWVLVGFAVCGLLGLVGLFAAISAVFLQAYRDE